MTPELLMARRFMWKWFRKNLIPKPTSGKMIYVTTRRSPRQKARQRSIKYVWSVKDRLYYRYRIMNETPAVLIRAQRARTKRQRCAALIARKKMCRVINVRSWVRFKQTRKL